MIIKLVKFIGRFILYSFGGVLILSFMSGGITQSASGLPRGTSEEAAGVLFCLVMIIAFVMASSSWNK